MSNIVVPTFDIGLDAADEIVIQRLKLCYEWMLEDMAKPNAHPEDMEQREKDLTAIMRVYEYFSGSKLDDKKEMTGLRKEDFEAGVAHERRTVVDYFRSLSWIHSEFDILADAIENKEHIIVKKRRN